jgi:hypothetical protein
MNERTCCSALDPMVRPYSCLKKYFKAPTDHHEAGWEQHMYKRVWVDRPVC